MWPFIIADVVGAGLSIYGQIKAANDQKDAAEKSAALKQMQADELLERQAMNEQILRERAERESLNYGSSFASTGREGGGIGGILQIHKYIDETISQTRRDAEFKAKMLRAGADIETQSAGSLVPAAYLTGAGNLLTAGARGYDIFKPSGSPTSLPKVEV